MNCLKCQKPFSTAPDQLCADCADINQSYLWLQLENARRERERARAALREIKVGIENEEENGLWEAETILGIIDRALSPEKTNRN